MRLLRWIRTFRDAFVFALAASRKSFAELDTTALGTAVAATAEALARAQIDKGYNRATLLHGVLMHAIAEMERSGADSLDFNVSGLTVNGRELGDWNLLVRRGCYAEETDAKEPGEVILDLMSEPGAISRLGNVTKLSVSVDTRTKTPRRVTARGTLKRAA